MSRTGQIDSLQAGRAFAALAVVVHHASLSAVAFASPFPGSHFLEYGYLGVDFFFVLSGFIIYHSSQGKGPREYALHRIRRVYLPYLPIGVAIAVAYTLLPQLSASNRSWEWLPTLTLLPVEAATALSVAWTLKHEILFYGLFAAFFFTGYLALGLAIWSALIVLAFFAGMDGIPLALINLEFVFGVIVALLAAKHAGGRWFFVAALIPLGAWIMLGADRKLSVLVGLAFALIVVPLVRLEREGRIRVPKWLLFLGAASYSLYLVHNVTISLVARAMSGHDWIALLIAGTAASIIAGTGYFLLVERPLLKLLPTRSVRSTQPVRVVAGADPLVDPQSGS